MNQPIPLLDPEDNATILDDIFAVFGWITDLFFCGIFAGEVILDAVVAAWQHREPKQWSKR